MSRDQESANSAALDDSVVTMLLLARLDFSSGVVAVHSGIGSYTYNSDTYTGVGELGAVSMVPEDRQLAGAGVQLQLSGVDSSLVSTALTEDYHGRSAKLYLLFLDSENQELGDPDLLWQGFMDHMSVDMSGTEAVITVSCESRLVLRGANISRFTDEEQQRRFSGDVGFEFLDQVVERTVTWGGRSVRATGASSQGRGGSQSGDAPGTAPEALP